MTSEKANSSRLRVIPILFTLDAGVLLQWLSDCSCLGLTDSADGRLEMCKAFCAAVGRLDLQQGAKPAVVPEDARWWEQTGCSLNGYR